MVISKTSVKTKCSMWACISYFNFISLYFVLMLQHVKCTCDLCCFRDAVVSRKEQIPSASSALQTVCRSVSLPLYPSEQLLQPHANCAIFIVYQKMFFLALFMLANANNSVVTVSLEYLASFDLSSNM